MNENEKIIEEFVRDLTVSEQTMAQLTAVVGLLIKKNIITREEYLTDLKKSMEELKENRASE